jgi:hypothetical protein
MKKDTHNKATLVIDRRNWAQKVMYRYTELTNKAIVKRQRYINEV